jgi:hypothetical protein
LTEKSLARPLSKGSQANAAFGRGNIFYRLLDQGLWSGAFFAFNLVAASVLTARDFAALTVSTSIGVIVAACLRAYAVDGRVIAGARIGFSSSESLSRRSVFFSGMIGASLAGSSAFIWLAAGGSPGVWWLPMLAGAVVLADCPHYAATMYGLFRRAALTALVYLVLAAVVLALNYLKISAPVGLLWLVALAGVWAAGLLACRPIPWRGQEFSATGVTFRLSGEALYSALGGQLGVLIIFLTSPPDDTAGIRLAYSLVFAPVFMLIQGLSPLFLSKMAHLNLGGGAGQMKLLAVWSSVSAAGILASGGVGAILSRTVWLETNFAHVMPFLLPVGAAMLGSLLLDSALLLIRFRASPKIPHRVRLVVLTAEASTQMVLALTLGTTGLVTALMIGFLVKAAVASTIAVRFRSLAS